MNAEIIAVGTELLLGDIVNTNAQFISQQLAGLGIGVYFQTVVGDNAGRLLKALETAFNRAELVIATGGLGPTDDDLTKETGAEYFGKKLYLDDAIEQKIEHLFKSQGLIMPESNKKQAYVPEGAHPVNNNNGTAPGIIIEENGKTLIMLPGPPAELIPMFNESILPYLQKKQDRIFVSKSLCVSGVGESAAEARLKDLIDGKANPSVATYAKFSEGFVSVRITASAQTKKAALDMIEPVKTEIYTRLNDDIFGEDDETLESALAKLLLKKGLTLAIAESCTGGMLTSRLVDYPGISGTLLETRVTYANEAKIRLGVKPETLATYGAVSKETALEMALCAAKVSGADVGISTTGVAGPGGGTDAKPVGLCYIGVYYKGKLLHKELRIKGNREKVRVRTVTSALDFTRRIIYLGDK